MLLLTSVAYIGPMPRTEAYRKTKIGTEVAHVTRDSDTTFKVKRSKLKVTRPLCSPPCWRVRRLQRWVWERVGRGKLLLRCRLLGGAKRFGAHRGRRGAGHIVAAARLQLVSCCFVVAVSSSVINRMERFATPKWPIAYSVSIAALKLTQSQTRIS